MITMKWYPTQDFWRVSMGVDCLGIDGCSRLRDCRAFVQLMGLRTHTDTAYRWVVPSTLDSVTAFTELKAMLDNPEINPADIERVYDQLVEGILENQHARTLAAGSVFAEGSPHVDATL